jgi:hypothetical protein
MRRFLLAAVAAAAVAGPLAAAAIAASGVSSASSASGLPAASPASRGKLRDPVCQKALDPGQRSVSVTAVMKPLAGTRALQMRFELLTKSATDPAFVEVHGGDLDTWISPPKPTLGQRPGDVWQLNKPVADLPAPAVYRFRVTFRWIGAHNKVLGSLVRNGPKCAQPELRPDLQVLSFVSQALPKKPKRNAYIATITNAGATPAREFEVDFSDGTDSSSQTVAVVRAHQTITLTFEGPVCDPAAPPTVTVDPLQVVDDYNRANNVLTATCS